MTRVLLFIGITSGLLAKSMFARQDSTRAAEDTLLRTFEMPTVVVVGSPERLPKIAGSVSVLDGKDLSGIHGFNTNEALRKVPGVTVREEDSFAMRPNIGLRGLNPTRSTKVLFLEDGIPLTYAPYGDNASYYHPPIERFERGEVLKGSEQILFGPQTIGGVINYITPPPLREFGGILRLNGGNRDYLLGHMRLGGEGLVFDVMHKRSAGARAHEHFKVSDANIKSLLALGVRHALTLRANYYGEHSFVTYTGITEAERRNFGTAYNPYGNDEFKGGRYGVSATLMQSIGGTGILTTSAYGTRFSRDWWRQSSSTGDLQGGAGVRSARMAGQRIDPDTIGSVQGRLRNYRTFGIEPRLSLRHRLFGIETELNAGLRAHFEIQKRRQINGDSPRARTGSIVEDNDRFTDAYSGFLQYRFMLGHWTITPSARVEHVISRRNDHLTGALGKMDFTEIIPGFGVTFNPSTRTTLFGGFHRGFAPPRTEDLIMTSGGSGNATFSDVDPERSWNYELGMRTSPHSGVDIGATLFRNEFRNLIAVGSVAGGATPLAQAEALFEGLEFSGRVGSRDLLETSSEISLSVIYTFLPTATQKTPFVRVVDKLPAPGSRAGNRMPYASKHQMTTIITFADPSGWEIQFETVYVGKQFSDFANTDESSADGQFGTIEGYTLFNAALDCSVEAWGTTVFLAVKNLGNREYIADRTRGIRFGIPRLVQAGVRYRL